MNEMHSPLDEPMNQLKDLMNHLFIEDIKEISEQMSKQVTKKVEGTISEFNNNIEDRIEKAVAKIVVEKLNQLDKNIIHTRENFNILNNLISENQNNNNIKFEQFNTRLTELQAAQELSEETLKERHEILQRSTNGLKETINYSAKTLLEENQKIINSIKDSSNELRKVHEKQNSDWLVKSKEFFDSTNKIMISWSRGFNTRMVEFKNAIEQKFKTSANKIDESFSSIKDSIPQENSKIVSELKSELELKFNDIHKELITQRKINKYLIALLSISIINLGLILMMHFF